jgi:hypothetical protein
MDRKEEFLTKDILGNLSLRVAKKLPCLRSLNDSTIWDKPIELCKRIEENVREIDNVILEVRRDNGYYQNNSGNPLIFQVMLARVYILLYYRHEDDELYKAMVFPVLQENMGIYSEKLLNDIQSRVKKVQEIDRLIEQSRQEKKQNSKPKYALVRLNSGEADEYFSEFSNENLFREISGYLESVRSQFFPRFDVASIWLTAKDVVCKLWQEKAPENFIDRLYHKLSMSGGTGYVERGAAEGVLLCCYAMMRTVTKSDHFHKAIAYIEKIPHEPNDYDLLYDEIRSLGELMDHLSSSCTDYDYTGGTNQTTETFTKADVERILSESNEKYEKLKSDTSAIYASLKDENEQLKRDKEQLKKEVAEKESILSRELEEGSTEDIEWHDKVRLDLLLRLMKKDGANLDIRGNKTRAAEVMRMVTSLPLQTCKNFCTDQYVSTEEHSDEILRINTKLQTLHMEIRL